MILEKLLAPGSYNSESGCLVAIGVPVRQLDPTRSEVLAGRYGSLADIRTGSKHVRFTPKSGHAFAFSEVCPTKAETFHWTSPAKEACVVETDRQIDLCSEHAK